VWFIFRSPWLPTLAPSQQQAEAGATGALKPKAAVTISGVLNVLGAFLSVKVASTISGGIVDESKFHTSAAAAILASSHLGFALCVAIVGYGIYLIVAG
jgi:phosphate/sulfate permease